MTEPNKQVIRTGEVLPAEPATPNKIQLGAPNQIDMTGLTEQQVQQLRLKHAEGMLALNHKAQELHIDVAAMNAGLNTMASTVEKLSEAGDSVTITNVQKNALGQTEVIMGNTETAMKGKISRAQRGDKDRTLWYVIIAAVVIIAAFMAFAK
jgi:t-SNARE complex subunit (syntaxin)